MARRRGFHGQSQSQRRRTSWELGPDAVSVTASADGAMQWSNSVSPVNSGMTIARIRGDAQILITAASAVNSGFSGGYGLGVSTTSAVSSGAAALPDPVADADWDGWMVHQFFNVHAITATIADGANAWAAMQRFTIDSKAMRKFDDPEASLFGILTLDDEVGASTAIFHAETRILLFLP